MDALQRLLEQEAESCLFHGLITGTTASVTDVSDLEEFDPSKISPDAHLNDSQIHAVGSWRHPLSLIWGPPGMSQFNQGVVTDIPGRLFTWKHLTRYRQNYCNRPDSP